jgi:DNA repair exonuclease SbcCD nuclease subunit
MKNLISADWHLEYHPDQSPARSRDFYTASRYLIRKVCDDKDYTGILILGDGRDTPLIYPQHFETLLEFVGLAQRADKKIGLLMGNHDTTNPSWVKTLARSFRPVADLSTPDGIAKMGLNPKKVCGIHYTHRHQLAERIQQLPVTCSTLLLHQAFQETAGGAPFYDLNAQTVRSLLPNNPPLTIYSGDIHNPSSTPNPTFSTHIFSPGSLQVTDINELSFGTTEKFYITAEGDTLENPRHVQMPPTVTRPWAYLQITNQSQLNTLQAEIRALAAHWNQTNRPPGILRIRTIPDLYFATQLVLAENPDLKTPFLECRLQVKANKQPKLETAPNNGEHLHLRHQLHTDRAAWLRAQIEQLSLEDQRLSPTSQELIRNLCRGENLTKKQVRETLEQWRTTECQQSPTP